MGSIETKSGSSYVKRTIEKVITTLKGLIGHPLKRHITEIPKRVNNRKVFQKFRLRLYVYWEMGEKMNDDNGNNQ